MATGWAIEGHVKREDRTAYFVSDATFGGHGDALLKVVLKHESVYSQHQFGRIRLSINQGNPIPSSIPPKILKIVRTNQAQRNDKQRAALAEHYRDNVADDVEFVNTRDNWRR